MSKKIIKEKRVTVRLTNGRHSELSSYAKAHEMSLTEAVDTLLDKGIKAEMEPQATKADIEVIKNKIETLEANAIARNTLLVDTIKNQPISVQQLLPKHKIFKFLN